MSINNSSKEAYAFSNNPNFDTKVYTPGGICFGRMVVDKSGDFFLEVKYKKTTENIRLSTYQTLLLDTEAPRFTKELYLEKKD